MPSLRWKYTILILCICCAVLMLVLGLALVFGPRSRQASAAAPSVYILQDNGGYPALFQRGRSVPLRTYPTIYTHLLPEADAEALQNGIIVRSEAELQALLEDFDC